MRATRISVLIPAAALFATSLVATGAPALALPPTLDGDGDGWADVVEDQLGSDKTNMFSTPESYAIPVSCLDKADNDLDAAVDDADPGCHPTPATSGSFPGAGFDVFESEMSLDGLELATPLGNCPVDFEGVGPTVIRRGPRQDIGGGLYEIDVEIVAMQLTGSANLLPGSPCTPAQQVMAVPATILEDPDQNSDGKVTSSGPSGDFPAESFFDVFFLVDTPIGLVPGSLRVDNAVINTLPPFHTPNNPAGNPDCYEFGGVHEHCPKPPLDHFECYSGNPSPFLPQDVDLLLDQFLGSPATIGDPELICNAVKKNGVPIFDDGAHLVFHQITSPEADVVAARTVVVRNQFGTQTFTLGDRVELAVPSQKDSLDPPLALDHYTCYEVTGFDLNVPVSLEDQFGPSNTVVVEPWRLCNPAVKVHNGQLMTVQDPRWHLACYTIQPTAFSPRTVTTNNQFGTGSFQATAPWTLCAPSQKFFEHFEPRVPHTTALVDPDQGIWYLRDLAGQEISFFFGNPGDVPFMGDWDCDGDETPGLYRQSDGFVYLRNSNTQGIADIEYFFGNPGDFAVPGDFNNDGCDTLSIYRPSEQRFYIINQLGSAEEGLGPADFDFQFGNPGDSPVIGDWDGDGIDEVGLHRPTTGFFYWRDTLTTGIADGDIFFGDPNDRFIAGDWGIVDGKDTPAVFRPSDTTLYFRHTLTQGVADDQFAFGQSGWLPVAGEFGLD